MDARNLLSLSGVLLVLGTAGYYWGMGHQRDTSLDEEAARRPDYVVTGIRSLETDAAGQPSRRLEASALHHYDRPRDEAVMDRPVLTLYERGQEAWRLTAQRALSLDQNTEVRLDGGVHAERRLPNALPLTFDTPTLFAFPHEERLLTNTGVTIASPQGRLTSQRLEARVKTGEIMLTENVTGNYAPASR